MRGDGIALRDALPLFFSSLVDHLSSKVAHLLALTELFDCLNVIDGLCFRGTTAWYIENLYPFIYSFIART